MLLFFLACFNLGMIIIATLANACNWRWFQIAFLSGSCVSYYAITHRLTLSTHAPVLRLHGHMQHVAAARGSLLSGYCSLTPLLRVIIYRALACVSSLFPFYSWIGSPQIKHWLSSRQDPCCHQAVYPQTPGLIAQRAVEWRVAFCWGLLHKSSPSQVKGIEEQLGRLLFWHSLYVLLIGANWHRGAPLFLCIMRPSSPRREERAQTKGWGKIGHGLKQ